MSLDFFMDGVYGFYQYCVDCVMEEQNLQKYECQISKLQIKVNDILTCMPNTFKIDHLYKTFGSGQCNMYDMFRVDNMDGFITGYGNERVALLLYHYELEGYNYDDEQLTRTPIMTATDYVNWIELNVQPNSTKSDILLLSELFTILKEQINLELMILYKKEFMNGKEFFEKKAGELNE